MNTINQLASSLGRRDEVPNQELAQKIIAKQDTKAIRELAEHLSDKDKNIQSDSIKVLYEIGEQKPELIAPYDEEFLALLENKNNRLVWGAMTALDSIASLNPKKMYAKLPLILKIADEGSVITRDHGVGILIKLAAVKQYSDKCLDHLLDQMKRCPTNQLPMYAENALPVIADAYKKKFTAMLTKRLPEIEKESKKKRVEKVIKKLSTK